MSTTNHTLSHRESVLLDSIEGAAAIIHESGDIAGVNSRWKNTRRKEFFFGSETEHANFFEVCQQFALNGSDYGLKLILATRRVLDGEKNETTIRLQHGVNGYKAWHDVRVSQFDDSSVLVVFENITEKINADLESRDAEERYRQHFNFSPTGIILGTPDGDIMDANPAACAMLGYTREELRAGGRELIVDMSLEENQTVQRVRDEKSYYEGEKVYTHKTGRQVYVQMSSVLYRQKDGQLSVINTFKDITPERETERKLQTGLEFTNTALDSIPGTFFVLDEEGNYIRWNKSYHSHLGYTDEEMQNIKALDLIVEEDQNDVAAGMRNVLVNGEASMMARVYDADKNIRHFRLTGKRLTTDEGNFIVGGGMDVTDLVHAEEERSRNTEMLRQLFLNSPFGMAMVCPDDTIMSVNRGFTDLFGFEEEEIVGARVNELIVDEDHLKGAKEISEKSFQGESMQVEAIRRRKDGTNVPVLITSAPVIMDGKIIAVYGIYVDLSDQKQMENKINHLLESEKAARGKLEKLVGEKDVLIQEVHHRVKNNLAVISGLLELQSMEETSSKVARKLNLVQSRIHSIAQIHETLYQEDDIIELQFHHYVKAFLKNQLFIREADLNIELDLHPVTMNLNQAVPCGLVLNELINTLLNPDTPCDHPTFITLLEEDGQVRLRLEGTCLEIQQFTNHKDNGGFQYKMIDVLTEQLDAELELYPRQNFVTFSFNKVTSRGSSSSIKPGEFETFNKAVHT